MNDVDLTEFNQISASLFTRQKGSAVIVKNDGIVFNSECLNELDEVFYIQMVIDKSRRIIYVIGCEENDANALKWCNTNGDKRRARKLSGKGFAELLFQLMNWDVRNRYIVRGEKIQVRDKDVIKFSLNQAENETDYKINRIVNLLKNVHGVVIPDTEKNYQHGLEDLKIF